MLSWLHKQSLFVSVYRILRISRCILEIMTTDEEKSKISKLLQGIEIPDIKLTERCSDIVKEFHKKYDKEIDEEEAEEQPQHDTHENPYKVDRSQIEEIDKKLRELVSETRRVKKENSDSVILSTSDPKRPWRINSNKEKLIRIDGELKRHDEKSMQIIEPLSESEMQELVKECREETLAAPPVSNERLLDTVNTAKKTLPNFQYKKIHNTTATSILPDAHEIADSQPVASQSSVVSDCNVIV